MLTRAAPTSRLKGALGVVSMPPEKLDDDDLTRLGELLRFYRDKRVVQRGERATRGECASRIAYFCRLDGFPEHKKAVEELSTAGRRRTLLLMLEALYRFETHGAVHGGEPPSADYFGRPGVQDNEVDAREVMVIHDNSKDASAAPESTAAKLLATQVATLAAQLADANAAADAARAAAAAAQTEAERVTSEKAALVAAVANEVAQHKQTAASLAAQQQDNETLSAKLEAAEAREAGQKEQAAKARNAMSVLGAALREGAVHAKELQLKIEKAFAHQ